MSRHRPATGTSSPSRRAAPGPWEGSLPAEAPLASREGAGKLASSGDVELGEDLAQVVLHRARADEQLHRDLRVGLPVRDQPGDLLLLRRENRGRAHGAY